MLKQELVLLTNNKDVICFINKLCACSALAALDGYSPQQDPDNFHIQTDEDDERYFLYQTKNGQYRKERRLKDGSVVGTTGWVGADGFLRLQDYIADGDGYRIYKSKTVYVGQDRSISESLNIAKTAPTDSGYAVTPAPSIQRTSLPPRVSATTEGPSPAYQPQHTYPSSVSITPATASHPHPTITPQVFISPNSIDSSSNDIGPTVSPNIVSAPTSTPTPFNYDPSLINTIEEDYYASDSRRYDIYNPNSYRHADDWLRRQRSNVRLGNGYTPQFATYDGAAMTKNGFRYYLPKQYHEEETKDLNDRTGSFGYVDPFGIRRVIYYNTAPGEGFQIRKNNRYVGHDATPYDPRPIN